MPDEGRLLRVPVGFEDLVAQQPLPIRMALTEVIDEILHEPTPPPQTLLPITATGQLVFPLIDTYKVRDRYLSPGPEYAPGTVYYDLDEEEARIIAVRWPYLHAEG